MSRISYETLKCQSYSIQRHTRDDDLCGILIAPLKPSTEQKHIIKGKNLPWSLKGEKINARALCYHSVVKLDFKNLHLAFIKKHTLPL